MRIIRSEMGWNTLPADSHEDRAEGLKTIATPWTPLEDPQWKMVEEWILVIPCPDQRDSARARSSIFLLFIVSITESNCALCSLSDPRVRTFQQAIRVLDFAWRNSWDFLVLKAKWFWTSLTDEQESEWDASPSVPHHAICKAIAKEPGITMRRLHDTIPTHKHTHAHTNTHKQ